MRIALAVARSGTVSGAAEALGVHHATVIRRIDALEAQLGARLFQRHPRGYALTEAGQTLLRTADEADERFQQMAARIAGTSERIEGELIITTVAGIDDLLLPALIALMTKYRDLRVTYLTDSRLFRLAAGEAHIAIRAGMRPTQPDYVVQRLGRIASGLYASQAYLDAFGADHEPNHHRFVAMGEAGHNAPYSRWLRENVASANVVMVADELTAMERVIRAGLAAGGLSRSRADGLVQLNWPVDWSSDLWLVTHVDLHRTPKIQAALAELRGAFRDDRE
ncbi:LysR family transcriptional regulator [Paracoccus amoyensis]|uniref:LysR family transcriptional regulator n=1 Tax=Paracoccus amoyensis TaxID=2760093 RepID=UPI0031B5653A